MSLRLSPVGPVGLIAPLAVMGGLAACSNSGGGFGAVDAASDAPARDGTVHDATGADVAQSGDGGADGSGEDAVAEAEVDAEALPEAAPPPIVLASDVPNPSLLVTDGAYLYWTDFIPTDAGSLGRVMKMPVTGGTEITLATEAGRLPFGLAVDAYSVYWVDDHATLFAASLDGGAPVTLATGAGPTTIAADGQYVYIATSLGVAVARVPLDGGPAVTLASPDAGFGPAGIAIDTQSVYWPAPLGGAILTVPKAGGTPVTLVSNGDAGGAFVSMTNYQNVVSDGTNVYWNLYPGGPILPGGVLAMPLDAGAATADAGGDSGSDAGDAGDAEAVGIVPSLLFDAGAATPLSVVADGANVYFLLLGAAPSLVKVPLDGGVPMTLATNQFSAQIVGDPGPTVAVDSTSVYWLSPPQILKTSK